MQHVASCAMRHVSMECVSCACVALASAVAGAAQLDAIAEPLVVAGDHELLQWQVVKAGSVGSGYVLASVSASVGGWAWCTGM